MNKSRLLRSRKVGKVHILLIATGSVASIKVPNMITALCEVGRQHIDLRPDY
jgi:phosphopantothenoylcysteine synthetase/decarboxylase